MGAVAAGFCVLVFFGLVLGLPALWQWRLDVADKKAAKKPGLPQDFHAMLDKDAELKAWWEEQMKLTRADELPEMEEVRNVTEEARSEEGPDDEWVEDEWVEEEVLTEAVQELWRVLYSDRPEVDAVSDMSDWKWGFPDDERANEAWCGCSWTTRGERKYYCPRHRPEHTPCEHGGGICF